MEYNSFRDVSALCAKLEENIADESEARQGYYELMRDFANQLSNIEISELDEIISEELKHTRILNDMIYRRNGIKAED